jgi:hypothetical protein
MPEAAEAETFEQWAILELFGHNQIAGLVSEQSIAGGAFIRVDVPEIRGAPAFTKFYNASAVYAITPCTHEAAITAAQKLEIRPVSVWIVPNGKQRQLSAPDPDRRPKPDPRDYQDDPDWDDYDEEGIPYE